MLVISLPVVACLQPTAAHPCPDAKVSRLPVVFADAYRIIRTPPLRPLHAQGPE
jgi:hypothetical protein